MSNWFDELSDLRKSGMDAVRRNKWDKGIRRATVDKYPDPAHFVYELLQNAEDQKATKAEFLLAQNELTFTHNGSHFTAEDVENITGIGNSEKTDDDSKIGRFGIGFKSVFAVTHRPEIYTNLDEEPFAFAIENLVVPVSLPSFALEENSQETKFVFPFIKEQCASLYSIILERLKSLGADVLLFLDALDTIYWRADQEEGTYFCERRFPIRGCITTRLVEEQGVRGKNKHFQDREYIQFFKRVDLPQSSRNLEVRIAFCMSEGRIVPEQGQQTLDVYFPTKEVTNLRFRVHAPTVLTDNRANIKENDAVNALLIQKAADLLTESLPRLRDMSLLDIGCLRSLPMDTEWNNNAFKPFYTETQKAFRGIALLPREGGGWVKSSEAKIADSQPVQQLLTSQQLTQLFGSETPLHWISTDITEKAQETASLWRYCRDVLKIEVFDPDKLAAKLTAEFLEMQDDDWMIRFYNFLSEREGLLRQYGGVFRNKPFIRLENGNHVPPFDRSGKIQFFLPRIGATGYPTVKIIFAHNTPNLFSLLGAKEPSIVDDAINQVLKRYHQRKFPEDRNDYYKDLKSIFDALYSTEVSQKRLLIQELNNTPFVLSVNANTGREEYRIPRETFIQSDSLEIWYRRNESAWFVSQAVLENTDWKIISKTLEEGPRCDIPLCLTQQPDVWDHVLLENSRSRHSRGIHRFDPFAKLDGLEHVLSSINHNTAKILWTKLLTYSYLIKGEVEFSSKQNYERSRREVHWSRLGEMCRTSAWLPKKDGFFYLPEQVELNELPDDFETNTDLAKYLACQLGMKSLVKSSLQVVAEQNDIPASDMEWMIQYRRNNPAGFEEWRKQVAAKWAKPQFPSRPVFDPDRRGQKAEEAARHADSIEYEKREHSVRVSSGEDPDPYLRSLYTNHDDEMVCQICENCMPFRRSKDGMYYFEAVQCVKAPVVVAEYKENRLALCPVCAAKYKHANSLEPAEIYELVLEANEPVLREKDTFAVKLVLSGEDVTLRFVEKHWIDIQAAFRANEKRTQEGSVSMKI